MQTEFDDERPDLEIQILTVNEVGREDGIEDMAALGDLPLLQDTVEENVWGLWDVTYRDVYVVDEESRLVAVFNLTGHSLEEEANFEELKALFIAAAEPSDG